MKTLKTLNEFILNAKEKYGEEVFIKDKDNKYTYNETIDKILKWGNYLKKQGVKKLDRVAIVTPKSMNQLKAFYAIWIAGGITLPINEGNNESEFQFILEDAEASLIMTTSALEDILKKSYPKAKIVILEELDKIVEDEGIEATAIPLETKESDTATLIYTSGSTGNPKGIELTHENLLINGNSLIEVKKFTKENCFYSLLPYWHSFSLMSEVVATIIYGGSIGFTKNQRSFVSDIVKIQPTMILVVPRILDLMKINIIRQIKQGGEEVESAYKKLLEIAPKVIGDRYESVPNPEDKKIYDELDEKLLKNIRKFLGTNFKEIVSGGGALDINLQRYFGYLGIPVVQGYGLSEASPMISLDVINGYSYGSVGDVVPWLLPENGGDFTFEDEFGNRGKDLKGELLVKGGSVMKGYWNHKDKSAKALKDGWLFTGDVGYYENNKLYLNGRKTNMIVLKGGENIHPEYIEGELKKSDIIDDVMVFGDGCKNVYACLTIPEDYKGMDEKELKLLLKEELKKLSSGMVSYQKPKDFVIVTSFSTEDGTYTGTLKIRRHMIYKRDKEIIEDFLMKAGERE